MSPPSSDADDAASLRRVRHPALLALGVAILIIAAAFVPAVWQALTAPPGAVGPGAMKPEAPWHAVVGADGSLQALGLRLPGSTLADAQRRWGDGLQVALMVGRVEAGRDELPALEASVESAAPGGVSGRVVLGAQATPAELKAWAVRAAKHEQVSASTRRLTLNAADAAQALRSPITSIAFIPTAQLDAEILRQRFGEPQQVIGAAEALQHWLYPARGLSIALDPKGRELLQFVPPAEFDARLRAPLLAAPANQPGS